MEKRLIPVNIFDTSTMEQWLSQMGEEGLTLDSFSGRKAVFQDGCCQKIKYRLIPTGDGKEEPTTEMKELFEEEGWHYVTNLEKTFFVFSNDAAYPKAIPFTKDEEREIYEELKRKKRNGILFSLLGFLFLGGMQLFLIYIHIEDYVLGDGQYVGYTYIVAMLINMIGLNREYRSYKLIKEKLENLDSREEIYSPYIPTTRWLRVETILHMFTFLILLLPLLTIATEGSIAEEIAIDEIPISYVSLGEFETGQGDREYDNVYEYAETSSTFFAPVQYVIEQEGEIRYNVNGIEKIDEVHLDCNYYELRFEALGDEILQGLIGYYNTENMELEGVDQARIAHLSGDTEIFLLKDNKILRITYQGDLDIRSHISTFIEML